ncbi:MAG: ComF family protein [Lutibacter sp.]
MKILSNLLALFYPKICLNCNEYLMTGEKYLCIRCRHDLPLTHFTNEKENLVEKSFYGRCQIEEATALFFYYKKSIIQSLIHELKYRNQQQVGQFIGSWLGQEIVTSNRFKNIDFIIPVPLHAKKLKKRGYNQLTKFGLELSKQLNVPFCQSFLVKITKTNSQTKKMRFERWKNVQELFLVKNKSKLKNKHILLIDDIITTGATLASCCHAFENIPNLKISIACMAYTK